MKKSIRKNYRYKMKMKRKEEKKWNRGLNLHKILKKKGIKCFQKKEKKMKFLKQKKIGKRSYLTHIEKKTTNKIFKENF